MPRLALTVLAGLVAQQAAAQVAIEPARYGSLKYRHVGPVGNRVSAVAAVPGDPSTYYAGAASGGLWKSTDGGNTWQPIFDGQPVSSIGALAVAPSDPNVVWAGTGEPFIRSNISVGWGMFRSTDAGKTWSRAGLELTGRIGRIVVDPRNPDVAFAAALGHGYGPQPERGGYRTVDGGKSWEKTLFVNDSTGAIDLVMDPSNPRILYAATWQIEIHTWGRTSGGAGSGIWKTTDGGTTWKRLQGNGLPTKYVGKIGLGIARSNPNRVYALIETSDGVELPGFEAERGELWRSDDAGATWTVVSYDRELAGRTQYYTRMAVAPDNENEAWFLTSGFPKTLDGGRTTTDASFTGWPGWDHHDMWIDPTNANRMVVGSDGGISISTNRGRSWKRTGLPIAQMYHVTVDDRVPYWVYGNRQDGPSARGPSNSKFGGIFGPGSISSGMWGTVGGGESGWATPDPADSNIVWSSTSGSGAVGGIVVRHDLRTGISRNVEVWPLSTGGWPAAELRYRFVWNFPLTISPHDPNRVYVGSQHVHVTTNGGQSWQVLGPDLTRNDKSRQQISGGLTPDNIGVEYAGVLYAIAESRVERGLIWAGSNDGLVHLTRDNGATWTNVTSNIPGLVHWGTISNIDPSPYDAGTAYLTVDGHQVNNRDPWVYKTTDYGKSWKLIVNGIPKSPLSYAHVVRQDPVRKGLLYLGTENALYVSFNDGEMWQPLQTSLPPAPVYEIVVQERFADLVIATYGRGIWILDDLTPLRQLTAEVTASAAHLFTPREAWRFRMMEPPFDGLGGEMIGQNPPYGASINYWLKAEQKDSVTLTIVDPGGKTVRTLKGPGTAGINRAWWDLRGELNTEAKLRVPPLYAPDIVIGPDGKPAPDMGRGNFLLEPGTYTVKLSAAGQSFSQPIAVRKDPNSGGSEVEIAEQAAMLREVVADLNAVADMVNGIERARAQIAALKQTLGGDEKTADVRNAADSLEKKLVAVEEDLIQLWVTGRGQDGIRYPQKLGGRLLYLGGGLEGSDFRPTDQQREAHQALREQLRASKAKYDAVMTQDVAAFNAMLQGRGLGGVVKE